MNANSNQTATAKPAAKTPIAVLSGRTGTIVRVDGHDYYYQPKRGASWIDLSDMHHVGQRSLRFVKVLAATKASAI